MPNEDAILAASELFPPSVSAYIWVLAAFSMSTFCASFSAFATCVSCNSTPTSAPRTPASSILLLLSTCAVTSSVAAVSSAGVHVWPDASAVNFASATFDFISYGLAAIVAFNRSTVFV